MFIFSEHSHLRVDVFLIQLSAKFLKPVKTIRKKVCVLVLSFTVLYLLEVFVFSCAFELMSGVISLQLEQFPLAFLLSMERFSFVYIGMFTWLFE